MRTILLTICLSALPALAADTYTFNISPAENVSDPTGLFTLTGWGYTLQNQSSTDWLVTTGLSVGTFLYATPQLLFDFPDLAPGATVTVPYNPVSPPGAGLYQILWDQDVPPGFVNSGTFTLSAQWWSGDPLNGGTLISIAPGQSQPYSASLTPVPEPITLGFTGLFFLVLWADHLHRGTSLRRRSKPIRL
jgi:hypothetical protein